ncbi:MAG: Holliday junction branch migration protein RuvA [Candidatus Magasanikbacteria bacterium CG11_big_fil_rev_8_21_14_0_20_43_7]|uniref:Holliday junction branch migration complex subunit RuvA n=1 Tax=Candidatus Magasanikbacteria bacterium CG11_big_fil_rev_8_21_14_0_20_43_7 TaxID=1974654 RepID=A0A2H0N5E9_9BACT|nr:MAG: Holliday junction branch migration protein RuvA [Candidatus Magasanikbacteria bacterium CG11_big_fil_rev_8_21_14_0_20_43_7]
MISYITGIIHTITPTSITLMTAGGVGYEITTTRTFASQQTVGQDIAVNTYLKVSEQAMQLFGFASAEERSFFELLLSVSGVGPRTAMNILGLGSITETESAISRGDATYLSAVQGIGKKTAERMVVELKSKVAGRQSTDDGQQSGTVMAEVVDALVSMGYEKGRVRDVVKGLEGENTEVLLRKALQSLAL